MDYKELIERLKYYGTDYATGGNLGREIMGTDDVLLDAAVAIETLLAEREAAIQSIPRNCDTCRYWYDGGCVAPLKLFGGCDFGVRQAWDCATPTPPDRPQTES